MSTINDRISYLIKSMGITKTKFAESINLSQPFVSAVCSGTKTPSDRTISDICREFGVSEAWLRTGEGDMFPPRDEMDELMAMAGRFLSKELTDFQQRWARMLFSLTPEEWALLERKALELTGQNKEKTEEP